MTANRIAVPSPARPRSGPDEDEAGRQVLLIFLLCLVWAGNYLVVKGVLPYVRPHRLRVSPGHPWGALRLPDRGLSVLTRRG